MYKSILVAVDGSEANRLAVDTAVQLAKTQGAALTAICVFDTGSYAAFLNYAKVDKSEIDAISNQALEYVRKASEEAGVELSVKRVVGKPVESIVAEAANHGLVVCGTHGRTGVSHALIGSVAERVVRFAPCPVLVVRNPDQQ
ncbi:MAG: universal stress protein [Thermoplasmata archaeon]|nr:universal stress protein [Thermoplasmata archaeon]